MKRASILYAVAERDSHAMRWLRLAAAHRRAGRYLEARGALLASRLWPNPRLPA